MLAHHRWRLSSTVVLAATRCLATASPAASACPAVDIGMHNFELAAKSAVSPDSFILTFNLPASLPAMGMPAPSGVKLILNGTEKSYSPVSHEATPGTFDLLVKAYPPRDGGGFGAFLCDLKVGETAPMKIKPARKIHGSTSVGRRWAELGMIAGGTGVAPFVQIIRSILADSDDRTRLSLLSINRHEKDILMRTELDELSRDHPGRFSVTYSLTQPPGSWQGDTGRGSTSLATRALPNSSSGDVMVMVCGTDGFVETWAGALERVPADAATGRKKQKLQGPVGGFLKDLGFREEQVYKF